jgi:hypothetical protein
VRPQMAPNVQTSERECVPPRADASMPIGALRGAAAGVVRSRRSVSGGETSGSSLDLREAQLDVRDVLRAWTNRAGVATRSAGAEAFLAM